MVLELVAVVAAEELAPGVLRRAQRSVVVQLGIQLAGRLDLACMAQQVAAVVAVAIAIAADLEEIFFTAFVGTRISCHILELAPYAALVAVIAHPVLVESQMDHIFLSVQMVDLGPSMEPEVFADRYPTEFFHQCDTEIYTYVHSAFVGLLNP